MITKAELQELLTSTETYRVERTISTGSMDKFCEAICAFSNDMPNSRKNGYLIIGAHNNGSLCGLKVDDDLMKKISAIRSDGNILPIPVMNTDKFTFENGDLLVVEVQPSLSTPVRYRGRTYIRIGPRKDIASLEEERILTERSTSNLATFDITPCREATIDDLDVDKIKSDYLPQAIDPEILESDKRPLKEQLASLRLYNLPFDCPTYAAIILFGKNPKYFLPGTYVQYVHFVGYDKASEIINERVFTGSLLELLPKLDLFLDFSIVTQRPVPVSILREKTQYNYPKLALRELLMNACMHSDYQSNMPIRLYQFKDRIEIMNAGGLYGQARPENFPEVNDYRNPVIAEGMKNLKYVNMFNRGIDRVQTVLKENGNEPAIFDVEKMTVFEVTVIELRDENFPDNKSAQVTDQVSDQVSDQVTDQVSNQVKELVNILEDDMTRVQLMDMLGIKSVPYFRKKYIQKSVELGVIELTQPNSPNSPTQKYRLTEKGKQIKINLNNLEKK